MLFGGSSQSEYNVIDDDDHAIDSNSNNIISSGVNSPFIKDVTSYQDHSKVPTTSATTHISQAILITKTPSSHANGTDSASLIGNGHASGIPKSSFNIDYELKEEIGVGSTSKCFRCVRKSDGKEFACKVIDKRHVEAKFNGSLLDQFFVEIKVLKSLNHPNIIHLQDTYETPDRIYMVMEMMKGGELFDYVVDKGTLSEEEACIIIRKITSAIAHMHGLNIIHRDLKPENLLLTTKGADAEIKLIDFGLAKEMDEGGATARSFLGTRGYLAPEMIQRHSYDKEIDIWALGVIAFVLLCGCLPFDDDSSRITSDSAVRKKFTLRFPRWAASLSASAKDLLHNLLDINPKTRFTAEQALSHPWVTGRTVQPNNYLQSPSLLGDTKKRQELRQEMNKSPVMRGTTGGSSSRQTGAGSNGQLDPIKEDHRNRSGGPSASGAGGPSAGNSKYMNFNLPGGTGSGPNSIAGVGYVRKNSI